MLFILHLQYKDQTLLLVPKMYSTLCSFHPLNAPQSGFIHEFVFLLITGLGKSVT